MTDGLDKLQTGAAPSLAVLYGRYAEWFRGRLIYRYGPHEAEDLAQEAWLRLAPYQDAGKVRHPKALLLKIAANLANDRYARRKRDEAYADHCARLDGWGVQQAAQTEEVFTRQMVLGLPQPLRDRIVVGEMRDGAAALETLKSWNTGHPGGLSTLHANSAEDVLRRVEDLIAEVVAGPSRRAIAQAVDRIVHIRRTPDGRRVDGVFAVEGLRDDGYLLNRLA